MIKLILSIVILLSLTGCAQKDKNVLKIKSEAYQTIWDKEITPFIYKNNEFDMTVNIYSQINEQILLYKVSMNNKKFERVIFAPILTKCPKELKILDFDLEDKEKYKLTINSCIIKPNKFNHFIRLESN